MNEILKYFKSLYKKMPDDQAFTNKFQLNHYFGVSFHFTRRKSGETSSLEAKRF